MPDTDEKQSTVKLKEYLNLVEYPSKSFDQQSFDNILNNVFDQVESTHYNSNSEAQKMAMGINSKNHYLLKSVLGDHSL